ncbi:MAG TPA: TonB-dependent receptor [Bryobacteraceae bacterium]|nr:TonB-dependent receptor [Bryobacteraceae bacterium]
MTIKYSVILLFAFLATLVSTTANAQSTISGQVRDSSGAVMAGVKVGAASPSLIEGSRTVTTNGEGRYAIVDVRPGTYTVTFSIEGFANVTQTVEVPANVTVPVDATMQVGAVGQTVEVQAVAPTVDVENAAHPTILSRQDIDSLPTARNMQSMGSYTPGVHINTPDVAGSQQIQQTYLLAHGNTADRDTYVFDGMMINTSYNNGAAEQYISTSLFQEVTYQTSNISVEATGGGVYANFVPKDGGNQLHGDLFLGYIPAQFVGTNINPALTARGVLGQSAVTRLEDFDGSLGGRIIKDKLWFLISGRKQQSYLKAVGTFNPDGSPGIERDTIYAGAFRLTYQANSKNKFSAMWLRNWKTKLESIVTDTNGYTLINPYETAYTWLPTMYYIFQGKWTYTATPRLLLEAGTTLQKLDFNLTYSDPKLQKTPFTPEWQAYATEDDIVTNTLSVAGFGNYYEHYDRYLWNAAGTYVTGTHQIRFGIQDNWGPTRISGVTNGDGFALYKNQTPYIFEATNDPYNQALTLKHDLGIFAQDTWHVKRLSITAGVRWEYLSGQIDHETAPAGRFVGPRDFPLQDCSTIKGLGCFKNLAPRIGVVYDVFGNHRTALKAGFAKYDSPLVTAWMANFNPMAAGTAEFLPWVGAPTTPCQSPTGIPQPGCYYAGNGFNQGNIGPNPNPNFGLVNTPGLDPNFHREYQFQYNLGVQHELRRGVTLNFSWHRTTDYQQVEVTNYAVPGSAWTPVSITNPLNGTPITVFNLQPAYVGLKPALYQSNAPQSLRANSYNGFETSVVARFPHGAFVIGAWTIERQLNRACDESASAQVGAALNDPNTLRFCDMMGGLYQSLGQIPGVPYRNDFKLQGHVPIRWGIEASASLISDPVFGNTNGQVGFGAASTTAISGFKPVTWAINAGSRYPADCTCPTPGALVDPGLSATQGTETIQLIAPGTRFFPRLTQFDVGFRRVFRIHEKYTLLPEVQLFNFTNASTVLVETTALGSTVKPFLPGGPGGLAQTVLNPRMVRLNLQFKF